MNLAARDHLLIGERSACIAIYSKPHLQKLARLSWLAPDIVSATLEAGQPLQLTGRYLLCCGDIPFD